MKEWDTADRTEPIFGIDRLSMSVFTRLREIPAVTDFPVRIMPGGALGLAGDPGCG